MQLWLKYIYVFMHLIVTTNQEMEEYYTIFWMSKLRHREVERLA